MIGTATVTRSWPRKPKAGDTGIGNYRSLAEAKFVADMVQKAIGKRAIIHVRKLDLLDNYMVAARIKDENLKPMTLEDLAHHMQGAWITLNRK